MLELIKKLIGDKKEYKEQMKRVEALPEDYRFVFEKIHGYMWSFAQGDGSDMLKAQKELIELLEAGEAQGKRVLDVTGDDIVGFCDEFLRDTKKWTDHYQQKLNRDIMKKIGEGKISNDGL
ncbi:MAG: cytoplasmic protein [Clostridiales bacterium 43-6]|nr:MAG: cytoplasmic protein [Clostridiales bacterium 43-6]